jgi:hypothetical protein
MYNSTCLRFFRHKNYFEHNEYSDFRESLPKSEMKRIIWGR